MKPLSVADRREFLSAAAVLAASTGWSLSAAAPADAEPLCKLSLGEWSFHRALFEKKMRHFDVARVAKQECGIEAIEYSAQFFMDKAGDREYLKSLKKHAEDNKVTPVLITVDSQGNLGDPDAMRRQQAVANHQPWVEAAKLLGCEAIRVNAISDEASAAEQAKLVVDGLRRLVEFGANVGINVIVENHGGLSSNGKWLAGVVSAVDLPTCGTLPDFGNFPTAPGEVYDRYQGVEELMPFAKAVSAKSYAFDEAGNESTIDYRRMLQIVVGSGFRGYLGIEYEGHELSEVEGILATKRLLETILSEMS